MDKRSPLMFVIGLCATGLGPVGGVPPGHTVSSVFPTEKDVSATPIVFGDVVSPPDQAGALFAINKQTGELIWSHQISNCNGPAGSIARPSVAIHGDEPIPGGTEAWIASREGAHITAVERKARTAARALPACRANAERRWLPD